MTTEEAPQDRSVVPSTGRGVPTTASGLIQRGLALVTPQRNRQEAEAYCGWGCASLLLGQQQLHKAIQHFTQAIQEDPDSALAYYGRALAYRHLGQWPEAVQDFTHAFRLAPHYRETYYNREGFADDALITETSQGEEEYLNPYLPYHPPDGQWQQEIQDITNRIRFSPYAAELYYVRALAYRHCGQWYQALQDFERAVELHPVYQPIEAYYTQGSPSEFASAIDLLEKYHDEGYSYAKQSQYSEVIQSFTYAIALNPHFDFAVDSDWPGDGRDRALYYNRRQWAGVYYTRGVAYGHLGRWEEAREDFSEAIRLTPEDAHRRPVKPNPHADMQFPHHVAAYYWRAIAHRYLDCWEQAYKDYQHATALHTQSQDAKAMINYGRWLGMSGLDTTFPTQENLADAIRKHPEMALFPASRQEAMLYYGQGLGYCDLGLVLGNRGLGMWEQARQNFTEAIRRDSNYADAYYCRAITHRYLGQWQQAYEDYQAAARLEYGPHYWVTDLPYIPPKSDKTSYDDSERYYPKLSDQEFSQMAAEVRDSLTRQAAWDRRPEMLCTGPEHEGLAADRGP